MGAPLPLPIRPPVPPFNDTGSSGDLPCAGARTGARTLGAATTGFAEPFAEPFAGFAEPFAGFAEAFAGFAVSFAGFAALIRRGAVGEESLLGADVEAAAEVKDCADVLAAPSAFPCGVGTVAGGTGGSVGIATLCRVTATRTATTTTATTNND